MVERGATYERAPNDWYVTPREPIASLLDTIQFPINYLCDPCCGNGAMLEVFQQFGYKSFGFDIAPWGDHPKQDFLTYTPWETKFDIVTNPPYGLKGLLAVAFIARALMVTHAWRGRVAMLLPLDFDCAKTRQHWFGDNPAFQYKIVLLDRIKWFNNQAGSTNHAWFVWNWNYDSFDEPTIKYV